MKAYYYWEADYFENVIFRMVPLDNQEFTVEKFINQFNKIPSYKRKHKSVIELIPTYYYHYNLMSRMLHHMVKKNYLSVRYVSVGTRTEPIFKLND
jgi:hypothetical protein